MSQSGAKISPEVSEQFQVLKRSNDRNRILRYIIFKLSDDYSQIEVEHADPDSDWDNFREKLINATSKNKNGTVGKGPRYAVYDFGFQHDNREINKIILISWSPDDAGIHPKMVYAASKEALKRSLEGFAYEIQANDSDDLELESIRVAVAAKMGI
ncbi:actin depolymerizing protein [Trichoderma austrokoningii]